MKSFRQKVRFIIQQLKKLYGEPTTPLFHRNIYELFVATILSAQMRDDRLNLYLPEFFKHYPSIEKLAKAKIYKVEKLLKSVNLYKTKSRNIVKAAKIILKEHGGKIPDDLESLTKLPGIGRKTANVIMSEGFNRPQGIVVDTHVARLSRRLGLTAQREPSKIEKDLTKIVPKRYWRVFPLLLIYHGRNICTARNPKCERCPLKEVCPFYRNQMMDTKSKLTSSDKD